MNLGDFTQEELREYLVSIGESSFRAKQIYKWVHAGIEEASELTNISKALGEKLSENYTIFLPKIYKKYVSKVDKTVKYLMELDDGNIIETVVMDYHHGKSICVSSQVGCKMGCSFCASTLKGLVRSLTPFEMEGQIIRAQKDLGERISSVVIMGIGEPLDNYDNVVRFIRNVSSEDGVNLGVRHITLSTCGLADKIEKLAEENLPINLAISLHAPTDEKRRQIMPVAKAVSLKRLLDACSVYFEKTHRRITFEYALVKGKNASLEDARLLAGLIGGMNCHVNIIEVNPVKEREINIRTTRKETVDFINELRKKGINATLRRELGPDINASCGQLRNNEL